MSSVACVRSALGSEYTCAVSGECSVGPVLLLGRVCMAETDGVRLGRSGGAVDVQLLSAERPIGLEIAEREVAVYKP